MNHRHHNYYEQPRILTEVEARLRIEEVQRGMTTALAAGWGWVHAKGLVPIYRVMLRLRVCGLRLLYSDTLESQSVDFVWCIYKDNNDCN